MLTVAMALLGDTHAAEDVVHDVFVAFAQSRERFGLRGSLKGYLATCVANRAKDRIRGRRHEPSALDVDVALESGLDGPDQRIVATEQSRMVSAAMVQVPYEQRETIVLHLNADMTFREIARLQGISVSTAKGRYRYGMDKLRSILDGRV
jgi:RNA polymerase sigma-70 factor (ECF subfamily)